MDDLKEHVSVKFCFLLGKTGVETIVMLKTAYKENVMEETQVYEWFSCYKNGEMLIEDLPHSGKSSMSKTEENIVRISELIMDCLLYTSRCV